MPGKFNYRNGAQRFDLFTFYALLTKCKIKELLDKDGRTPFDSENMDDNTVQYAAYLYKDILDNGMVSYFDSDTFRQDSDGDNGTSFAISNKTAAAKVYSPLRKFLYAQSNNGGINESEDTITSGFNRKYYTLPVSDSDGTIKHVNVYTFLKSHFNRWISYDTYERYKLTTRVIELIESDSDISNGFADKFLKACEEDSDLSRRAVELYSNVMQTDSEVRNEILHTAVESLSGLTPGHDSESARALTEIISNVLQTDSEIRNEYGDHILTSLREDSDQQTELGSIISSTEIPHLQAEELTARKILPMDGNNTGKIGDSETIEDSDEKWAFSNFSTVLADNTKVQSLGYHEITFVKDSEGTISSDSDLKFETDTGNLVINKIVHMNMDSDVWLDRVVENKDAWQFDSERTEGLLRDTNILSELQFPIGQRGDIYQIYNTTPDSENIIRYDSEFGRDSDNSPLQTFFTSSTGLTWTFHDGIEPLGNRLVMNSQPGTNIWYEGNSTKPGGFKNATEASFRINGYGFNGLILLPNTPALEASNTASAHSGYVFTNTTPNSGGFYVYFQNGDMATTGGVYIVPYWQGTAGTAFAVPGLTAAHHGATYPITFIIGKNSKNQVFCRTAGNGSSSSTVLSDYFYIDASSGNITTSNYNVKTTTDEIQYSYGNYDGGPVEHMTNFHVSETRTVTADDNNRNRTVKLFSVTDKIVDTPAELARALNDVVTKQEVFNTWYRFSHAYGSPYFQYPFNATEMNSWAYDAGTDTIYTTANTGTYCGFVSPEAYDDYRLEATFNAPYSGYTNDDDDTIGFVIGFVTEGTFGQPGYREHTLNIIRTAGGFPMTGQGFGNVTWALVYNYNQNNVRMLVNGTSFGTASTGISIGGSNWQSFPNGSRVQVRRKGDQITAFTSQMNSTTIDSDTMITFDLSSDSDTLKFRGPVAYGFSAHSQLGSYWSTTIFTPDDGRYLYYVPQDNPILASQGGNVYEYDDANYNPPQWVMDSDLTIDNTHGERFFHNKDTHKTFINDAGSDKVYQIMTSRKFSDVTFLPMLFVPPDSDMLGEMGLRAGTIARASGYDNTNSAGQRWDPKGYGAGTGDYYVFYNGSVWQRMNQS